MKALSPNVFGTFRKEVKEYSLVSPHVCCKSSALNIWVLRAAHKKVFLISFTVDSVGRVFRRDTNVHDGDQPLVVGMQLVRKLSDVGESNWVNGEV